MFAGLRFDRFTRGNDEQRQVDAGRAGEHVADKAFVAGHVHDADGIVAELEMREADVDGDAAFLLFGQAVAINASQRFDQGGLPMIDVAGSAENEVLRHGRRLTKKTADRKKVLERQGTFSRVMAVQVPYHSHHMDPIEADLLAALAGLDLHPIGLPIVSEVSGDWANDARFDAAYWWRNIRQPVLFGAAVGRLIADGYDTFLELSPHPVLGASVNECLAHAGATGVCLPSLRRNDRRGRAAWS